MNKQCGSVLLIALLFIALLTLLVTDMITSHQVEMFILHSHYNHSVAFQAAEDGLYLGYQQLPKIGHWSLNADAKINYSTAFIRQDKCQCKTFLIKSTAEFKRSIVDLTATYTPSTKNNLCQNFPHWHWQQNRPGFKKLN